MANPKAISNHQAWISSRTIQRTNLKAATKSETMTKMASVEQENARTTSAEIVENLTSIKTPTYLATTKLTLILGTPGKILALLLPW